MKVGGGEEEGKGGMSGEKSRNQLKYSLIRTMTSVTSALQVFGTACSVT